MQLTFSGKEYRVGRCAPGVTPHVAQDTSERSSAIDGRTSRHSGYALSQR